MTDQSKASIGRGGRYQGLSPDLIYQLGTDTMPGKLNIFCFVSFTRETVLLKTVPFGDAFTQERYTFFCYSWELTQKLVS